MFVVFALVCSYVSDICLRNSVTRAGQFQPFDLPCSIHQIHYHPLITLLFFGTDFPPVRSEWHFPPGKTDINNWGLECKAVGLFSQQYRVFKTQRQSVTCAKRISPVSLCVFSLASDLLFDRSRAIAYVRCIKILTWLQGFLVIFLYFVWFFVLKSLLGIARRCSR